MRLICARRRVSFNLRVPLAKARQLANHANETHIKSNHVNGLVVYLYVKA